MSTDLTVTWLLNSVLVCKMTVIAELATHSSSNLMLVLLTHGAFCGKLRVINNNQSVLVVGIIQRLH